VKNTLVKESKKYTFEGSGLKTVNGKVEDGNKPIYYRGACTGFYFLEHQKRRDGQRPI